MQNFVPWIMPANPAWSSNHASDHTSEVSNNVIIFWEDLANIKISFANLNIQKWWQAITKIKSKRTSSRPCSAL